MKDDGSQETNAENGSAKAGVSKADSAVIDEVKKRLEIAISADSENHKAAMDDYNFLKGEQWPEQQRRQREAEGRPCLVINKIPTFLQQVTNDQRQNRACIKVSAVSESASGDVAEIIQGVIKHIEYDSNADAAYDTSVNGAASVGFGYFRICPEYESDTSFDQVLKIKRIRNSFTVHIDPASVEADGSDMQWAIVSERMTKDEFKARYPKAEVTFQGFGVAGPGEVLNKDWMFDNMVRVAEYYVIEMEPGTLYLLGDGTTTFEKPPAGVQVMKQRPSVQRKVMWYLLTSCEILESTEIMCSHIPVFPVYGTEIDIDGKVYRSGLVRNAKDPAMMYNYWMTSATEEVSLRPKTPYIGAAGTFEGFEKKWLQANNRTFPYLEYNPVTVDGVLAPPPQRQPMADVPNGILAMAAHASDNIKQTTGLFDSSLGAQGNATSGKQELAQQRQGSVTNMHYMDNFMRTLRHAGKCLIYMIPKYYDTERIVQCRGEDGQSKGVTINKWDEVAKKFVNDITVGKYDVAVTAGPSYETMRAEAQDAMVDLAKNYPKLMEIAGDKVVRAMAWPGKDEIADRLLKTIPPQLTQGEDGQEGPPPIPPQIQQQIQQLQQQLKEAQEAADKNKADILREQIKAESNKEVAWINGTLKKDVEELSGYVKLLIAHIQPPPEFDSHVSEDLSEPEPTYGNSPQPHMDGGDGGGAPGSLYGNAGGGAPQVNDPSQMPGNG